MPDSVTTIPDEGELDPTCVARLFAEAWRDRRSGLLTLSREKTERHIRFEDGAPTAIEGGQGEDDFAQALEDEGAIGPADRLKVERMANERECPQASAVLALRLLDPKSLYAAIRRATRRQLGQSLEWQAGRYAWSADEEEVERSGKPHDVLGILQTELPRRWGSERLFEAVMPHSTHHGDIAPHFRRVALKLSAAGDPARRALARLDGSVPLGQVLGECAGDPLAASTLWTILHAGILRLGDGRRAHEPELGEIEFEVEVMRTAGAGNASGSGAKIDSAARGKARSTEKSEALREQIMSLLERLPELDHYAALGLDEDANSAKVKRAYFTAAKKFHPDALARLGLEEIKEDAAKVFARIAEAFETLSDETKRAAYDSGASQEAEIDTARLAQAETSFRKGEILVKMGNFDGALEYLEPAAELWPEEPAYHAGLAWALYKQPRKDIARAREHFEIAAGQAPDNALILFRLGHVLRADGDTARAEEMIARARAIDPTLEE